jgi:predicted dehydrogenase
MSKANSPAEPLAVGVIGSGYWGPNLVRNLSENARTRVAAVADLRSDRLAAIAPRVPSARLTTRSAEVLGDPEVDAVAITTPVSTHFELARAALEQGKHVLVAKPLCSSVAEAEALVELAREQDRVLLVDHTFVYTGAVRRIRSLIAEGRLGELWYFDSVRVNLGLFQHDVNVIWDLAAHDFSILIHLLDGEMPRRVSATGASHSRSKLEDVAYVTLEYDRGFIAHFHLNWLSPVKIRQTLIGGSDRMLVWNDLAADEKVKVYDKGITLDQDRDAVYEQIVSYRTGDAWIPQLDRAEALAGEIDHFAACIRDGARPLTGGEAGRDVVALLAATSASLEQGRAVEIGDVREKEQV